MGPEQLAELVDRYAAALVLYARQWCGCPEDVVQTAFLKLVRLRARPDNLVPWLYRVVRNGAIDASRAARRRQKYEAAAADRADPWFSPPDDPTGLDARRGAEARGRGGRPGGPVFPPPGRPAGAGPPGGARPPGAPPGRAGGDGRRPPGGGAHLRADRAGGRLAGRPLLPPVRGRAR